ncbi:hypothetical protein BCR43DRAFT_499844 [Syncephalastrum racemosum]|uniref:Arrestin C-terminal-like domain-containing protein n=1 Tax=Syncephalastrum racemosum TaxID=13706 RepID=A0A1X2GZW5_SYNRA|nr:hypothetical protein BCR43DRAFT_499844 [Syncephalastrum racemosum]
MDTFNIFLESDELVMHGNPSRGIGSVLRGVVALDLKQPARIKSIRLCFTGQVTRRYAVKEGTREEEKTVINRTWSFLPSKKTQTLRGGCHTYDFELALPNNLPETTRVANEYMVHYRLKAEVEHPTLIFSRNQTCYRTVYISRYRDQQEEDSPPIAIADRWADKLDYSFTIPSRIVHQGERVPVTARVVPTDAMVRVRHVACTLKEFTTYTPHAGFSGRTHRRTIQHVQNSAFHRDASNEATLSVHVPRSHERVQCDSETESVKIRHRLKFAISVESLEDGHLSELRLTVPIQILAAHSEQCLPAYEDSSLPYDPFLMVQLMQQNNYHTTTTPITTATGRGGGGRGGVSSIPSTPGQDSDSAPCWLPSYEECVAR